MRTRRVLAVGLVVSLVAIAVIVWVLGRGGAQGGGRGATSTMAAAGAATRGSGAVDPRSRPRAEIRGTVRDPGGGPLAGAQICSRWWAEGLAEDSGEPACAIADPTGAYRLTGLVAGTHQLSASAPGRVPRGRRAPEGEDDDLELAAGEVREGVDFVLATGGVEVRGVVSDVSGGPIAGAIVSLDSGGWWSPAAAITRADAQGRFTLWSAPGVVRLSAEAEGYADGSASAVAPAAAVELLLTPESVLAGVVVAAGSRAPVADAVVMVELEVEDGDFTMTVSRPTRTGADGRFTIARLTPGRYKPTASAHGSYGEAADSVLLGLGQRVDEVVVVVHPARVVSGRIEIDDGRARRPCTRGWLDLAWGDRAPASTSTDERGEVELASVRPGRYRLTAHCDGYLELDDEELVVGDADVTGRVWTVRPGGTVRGVVRTAGGEPAADLVVSAERLDAEDDGRSWDSEPTRADGSFVLRGLPPGEYTVRPWSGDARGTEQPVTVTVAIGGEATALLVLAATGTVTGVVVDTSGAPVGGADVLATDDGYAARGGRTRSGEDGRFVIRDVALGPHRVTASRGASGALPAVDGAGAEAAVRVEVLAGKVVDTRLVVERRDGVITGRVGDGRGQPVADAWVTASREPDDASWPARAMWLDRWSYTAVERPVLTDPAGAFAVRELAPGRYTVRAFRRGGGEATAEHVATGGAVTLTIAATASLAGTAVLAGGAPPDELEVTAFERTTGLERTEAFYRTGGAFALRDLTAGTYAVVARGGGGRATGTVTLAAGQARGDLRLVLAGPVDVTGRLVELDGGAPIAGLPVEVRPRGEGASQLAIVERSEADAPSGPDGRFTVTGAFPGPSYVLGGNAEDEERYGPVAAPVELPAGAATIDVGDVVVARQRLRDGDRRGYLGVGFGAAAPAVPAAPRSLVVSTLDAGGPAAVAGVQLGDVLVAIDGHDVRGPRSYLATTLLGVPVGTRVALGLARGVTVTVTAAARP